MLFRVAAVTLLLTAPALAQEAECGACTELDRVTTAEPVPPNDLPPPPQKHVADRGKAIELPVPGTNDTVTVYHKPGAGVWVGDVGSTPLFVRPKKDKLSVEMKF